VVRGARADLTATTVKKLAERLAKSHNVTAPMIQKALKNRYKIVSKNTNKTLLAHEVPATRRCVPEAA
jgi:nitrate reductase cytochrome c-type subunit